jgi:excisionase family DNA binding protein
MTSTEVLPDRIMGTVAEAAALLGVGRQTVRDQIKNGTFPVPTRRFGNRLLINMHRLEQWCNEQDEATS